MEYPALHSDERVLIIGTTVGLEKRKRGGGVVYQSVMYSQEVSKP